MFAIAASTIFVACKKEEVKESPKVETTIQNDLRKISEKYQSKADNLTRMTKEQKLTVAAGADLLAAAEFVNATWQFMIIPTVSAALGTAVTIVAAGASIAAYNACGMVANPGVPNDPNVINNIINHSGNYNVPNPYNNPYEQVGIRHNELLKIYYLGNMNHPVTNNTSIFDSTQLSSQELQALPIVANNHPVAIDSFISLNPITPETGIQPFLNFCFTSTEDAQLKGIISTFYNGMSGISTLSSTMSYINDYENYFISNSTITAKEKQVLLTCFAVAKHSYSLWYQANS